MKLFFVGCFQVGKLCVAQTVSQEGCLGMSAGRSVCLSEQPKENHRLEAHAFGPKESTVFSFGGGGGQDLILRLKVSQGVCHVFPQQLEVLRLSQATRRTGLPT